MKRILSICALLLTCLPLSTYAYPVANGIASVGGAGITSLTITEPAGAVTGTVQIALVTILTQEAVTAPSGWALIDTLNWNSTWVSKTYWHCFTNGDPNPQWTFASANGSAILNTFNDVNCSSPIDKHELQTATSPLSLSTLTPAKGNSDIAIMSADNNGNAVYPTGWFDTSSVNLVAGLITGLAYFATGGTTATGTVAVSANAGAAVAAAMIILSPPTGGQAWTGIRAFTNVATGGSTASIPVPTNIQANDALVATCQGTQTPTFTATAGFNSIISNTTTYNFNNKFQTWCKDATGSESGTFGFTTSSSQMLCMMVDLFNSHCTGAVVASVVNNTATVNVTTPTVTTPNAKSFVVSAATTAGSGMTAPPLPLINQLSGTNGNGSEAFYQESSHGTTTGQIFTFSSASNVAHTIAMPNTSTPITSGIAPLYGAFP